VVDEEKLEEGEEEGYYGQNLESDDDLVIKEANQKKIIWLPKDHSIRELLMMKAAKELDLRPSYQRNFVFDKQKASRLIESILLDVPIPAIYFAEEADGKYSVIDGQQRLTSFISFIDEKFPVMSAYTDFTLSGLRLLTGLNKKRFSNLDSKMQLKIKNTALHTIIIKNDSDEDVKFEIIERLNTGSMKLNEDEIRNSVYRGPYIDLIEELSEDITFGKMIRKENYKNRMIYRGMVLRFLALSEKTYINYRPSMKQFCNKELRDNRYLSTEKAKEYRIQFRKCVDLCFSVFGENAFRRFSPGDTNNPDGHWTASRLNMALFDVQMCGFAAYDKNQIMGHTDEIRDQMMNMMCNDEEFGQAIEIQTSSTKVMKIRFKKWLDTLDSIVSGTSQRIYNYEVKKQLFAQDPTCGICHNRILSIEDAEVDHKDPYSRGGPTTLENAQIAHRFCNRHKSDSFQN
jgi:hypothetical protein